MARPAQDRIQSELEAIGGADRGRRQSRPRKGSAAVAKRHDKAAAQPPKYSSVTQMPDHNIHLHLSLLPVDRLALITILETQCA